MGMLFSSSHADRVSGSMFSISTSKAPSTSVFGSSSSVPMSATARIQTHKSPEPPQPDSANYRIERTVRKGDYLLMEITYPDCKNYEGRKILLFENTTLNDLMRQKYIDPHFCDNKDYKHPIARFGVDIKDVSKYEKVCIKCTDRYFKLRNKSSGPIGGDDG